MPTWLIWYLASAGGYLVGHLTAAPKYGNPFRQPPGTPLYAVALDVAWGLLCYSFLWPVHVTSVASTWISRRPSRKIKKEMRPLLADFRDLALRYKAEDEGGVQVLLERHRGRGEEHCDRLAATAAMVTAGQILSISRLSPDGMVSPVVDDGASEATIAARQVVSALLNRDIEAANDVQTVLRKSLGVDGLLDMTTALAIHVAGLHRNCDSDGNGSCEVGLDGL